MPTSRPETGLDQQAADGTAERVGDDVADARVPLGAQQLLQHLDRQARPEGHRRRVQPSAVAPPQQQQDAEGDEQGDVGRELDERVPLPGLEAEAVGHPRDGREVDDRDVAVDRGLPQPDERERGHVRAGSEQEQP
jgi:hypothetical protein